MTVKIHDYEILDNTTTTVGDQPIKIKLKILFTFDSVFEF